MNIVGKGILGYPIWGWTALFLIVGLIACSFTSGGCGDRGNETEYVKEFTPCPWTVGDKWEYKGYTEDGEYTRTDEVIDEVISDGKESLLIEVYIEPSYQHCDRRIWEVDADTFEYMACQAFCEENDISVVYELSFSYSYFESASPPSDMGYEYKVTEKIMEIQTKLGETQESTSEYTYSIWEKENMEGVTVPAGTFECKRESQYDTDDMLMNTLWYSDTARKMVRYIDHEDGTIWELSSYSVADI